VRERARRWLLVSRRERKAAKRPLDGIERPPTGPPGGTKSPGHCASCREDSLALGFELGDANPGAGSRGRRRWSIKRGRIHERNQRIDFAPDRKLGDECRCREAAKEKKAEEKEQDEELLMEAEEQDRLEEVEIKVQETRKAAERRLN
jgi:hypothetical protein